MNRLKQRKAFTIVEMIIVIAVIAILAAVLIPGVSTAIKKANVSADTQFAASLNIQLTLWEVDNGNIKNESDLRDAVNEYYGEYDADGKLTSDFYAALAPKSGKYGYHYWYDIENCRVVTCTYEMLADSDEDISAPVEAEDTFSGAGIRLLSVNGKSYLLMDRAGSALADSLSAVENPLEASDYVTATDKLQSSDDPLYKAVYEKLAYTAVLNENGMFTSGNEVSEIYIPLSAGALGSATYIYGSAADRGDITYKLDAGYVITVPSGVVIGSGGLNGLPITEYNAETNADMTASTEIHVDITVDELGETFGAGATNAVIVIANGERYVQDDVNFYKLPEMTIVEGVTSNGDDISVADKTFEIADRANTYEKYGIEFTVGTANKIRLDTLFSAKDGNDIGTLTVEYYLNDESEMVKGAETVTVSYWGDHEIDLNGIGDGQSIIITINNDCEKTKLPVRVKNGAYNVVDIDGWKALADNSSVVLLNDIDIGENITDKSKKLSYLNGNYHKIDATELENTDSAPERLIAMTTTGGIMEYVVIDGPAYEEVNTPLNSTKVFTAGVWIAGASIKNSYLSGFLYPVSVTGGTVSIENSVLRGGYDPYGGINSNIYCNKSKATIDLTNVTTIHDNGVGVYLGTVSTSNTIVNILGDTYQYNWFNIEDGASGIVSTIAGGIDQTHNHEINDVTFVNLGIVHNWTNADNIANVKSQTHIRSSILNYIGSKYYVWTYASDEPCTHSLLPDWGSTADEFLASREVSDVN